jgi:FixJ family two-component response regulator
MKDFSDEQTVFVVDDDAAVRDSLSWLIKSVGLKVETFGSAHEFLEKLNPRRQGVVVLDVRMPGMSGLELQEKLVSDSITLPVIIVTGHGDVPMAVRAVKSGAFDFIEKPFNDQVLLDRIQQAMKRQVETRKVEEQRADVAGRLNTLTPREKEVLEMVVSGNPNKVIAAQLGISCRTVEIHRGRVMEKMRASSLSELVRMGLTSALF